MTTINTNEIIKSIEDCKIGELENIYLFTWLIYIPVNATK